MRSQETYKIAKGPRTRKTIVISFVEWAYCALTTKEEHGLSKKEKKTYFDARQYVNDMLEKRTNTSLEQKNAQFAKDHAHATDDELLAYLKQCAQKLERHPHVNEVIGGKFIAARFGSWLHAMGQAGLLPLSPQCKPNARSIYRKELKIQAALYRKEKHERKQARINLQKQKCCQSENTPPTYTIE